MQSLSNFKILILVAAFALNGCAFSKSGRQQHAYEKYVRRSSLGRAKQQSHFHSDKPQMPTQPMPSEPTDKTENAESGPQAVPKEN